MQYKRGTKYVKIFDDVSKMADDSRVLESGVSANEFKKHVTSWSRRNTAGPMYLDDDNIPRNEVPVIRELNGARNRGPYRTTYFEGQQMLWDPAGRKLIRTDDYAACEDNVLQEMSASHPLLASWTNDRTAVTPENASSRFMKFGDRLLFHYKRADTAEAILTKLKAYTNFRGKNRRIVAGQMGFLKTDEWATALREVMGIVSNILYEHTAVKKSARRQPHHEVKGGRHHQQALQDLEDQDPPLGLQGRRGRAARTRRGRELRAQKGQHRQNDKAVQEGPGQEGQAGRLHEARRPLPTNRR
jgi:hypothetical protein